MRRDRNVKTKDPFFPGAEQKGELGEETLGLTGF
jgi:hypothetical protein